MLPSFEGEAANGSRFRSTDLRQRRHIVVAFVAAAGDGAATELADRAEEIRENGGELVLIVERGAALPALGIHIIADTAGVIAARFQPLVSDWQLPIIFAADRYGELLGVTTSVDDVLRWLFSAEVQCSL